MNAQLAQSLGYTVVRASPCEVGLLRDKDPVRTWWCSDFGHALPPLDHPEIMRAISFEENRRAVCQLDVSQ